MSSYVETKLVSSSFERPNNGLIEAVVSFGRWACIYVDVLVQEQTMVFT